MEINGITHAHPGYPTGSYSHIIHVNRYDYAQAPLAKKLSGNAKKSADAEQAIIDTIKYLGWMSLKDSDHCEHGKSVGQGDARRAAADRLLAAGTIILLGTWSNGIAVGPGAGFAVVDHSLSVTEPTFAPKKIRAPRRTKMGMAQAYSEKQWSKAGASCEMRYDAGATCPVTLAISKPRVRYTWPKMHGPAYVPPINATRGIYRTAGDTWRVEYMVNGLIVNTQDSETLPEPAPIARGIAEAVATTTAAPTPIYEPAVGESVFIVLRHENGTTTDRVVDVQRVKVENGRVVLFRGYDRRRDRCRNYLVADCAVMRAWDGLAVFDINGRVVVEARAA